MTGQTNMTRLTEFDLMMIRAGRKTQGELEAIGLRDTKFRCRMCAILADGLYQIVVRLEARANRSVEGLHRRFGAQALN